MTMPPPLPYMGTPPRNCSARVFLFYYRLHLVLALIMVVFFLTFVSRYQAIFKDFRTTLPAITEWVLTAGDFVLNRYWWVVIVPMVFAWPILPAWLSARVEPYPWGRRLLFVALLFFYLFVIGVVFMAIYLPLVKLVQAVRGDT